MLQYGKHQHLKCENKYTASDGSFIKDSSFIKDLGVTVSDDANFKVHIDNIILSTNKIVSWIYRSFKSRSQLTMLTLWKSVVLPKLEYCSQLWSPASKGDILKLELIQRQYVRKIKLNHNFDYWDRLSALNLYSLERRRERYRIIYTWKVAEGLVPNISIDESRKIKTYYSSRYGRFCAVPRRVTTCNSKVTNEIENSLIVCGPKLFNVLPQYIRNLDNCSTEVFKSHLDKFLMTVRDEPNIPGYIGGNNQQYGSNSLIDILAHSPSLN